MQVQNDSWHVNEFNILKLESTVYANINKALLFNKKLALSLKVISTPAHR